jgi:hypothetical protein
MKRLSSAPLQEPERQALRRLLTAIDAEPPLLRAELNESARSSWSVTSGRRNVPAAPLRTGDPVALGATALASSQLIAGASQAGYPIIGHAGMVFESEVIIVLAPPPFAVTRQSSEH